ncbi:MAG TPA: ATP-binding protein, partial [Ferruginibacter sp.]|nr:ATP-binding protein [Ferruginibacter sp.]
SVFLHERERAIAGIDINVNKVTTLTADNPAQQQNVMTLRNSILKRVEYMDRTLDSASASRNSPKQMLGGKILMNDIYRQADLMEREEQRLLDQRSALLNKEAFITPMLTMLLIVGAIIILVAAYIKITQELNTSDKLRAEVELANQSLQMKNEELVKMNKELESFTYISSHDLQEPLRKIQTFANRILTSESGNLTEKGKEYFLRMQDGANRMQTLIADLLAYSRTSTSERKFEFSNLNRILEDVKADFEEVIREKNAVIETGEMCDAFIIPFQFHQLLHNVIGNALKFSKPGIPPHILVKSEIKKSSELMNPQLEAGKAYCHISVSDNGIGFEPQYKDYIFDLFKRLHDRAKIEGTGIGLTIVKKIVENHGGIITATGELDKGATIDIYIPAEGSFT